MGACGLNDFVSPIPFHAYWPTSASSSWTYRVSDTTDSYFNQTITIQQSSAAGFKLMGNSENGPFLSSWTISDRGVSLAASNGVDPAGVEVPGTTYSPAILMLPLNASPGFTTSTPTNWTVWTSSSSSTTNPLTETTTVVGTESVTVPAGTFTALKVRHVADYPQWGLPHHDYAAWWFALGVGLIKKVAYADASASSTAVGTTELIAYSIK
jgi:hypothetical protein